MSEGEWRNLTLDEAQGRDLFGFGGSVIVACALAALLLVWQLYGALNAGQGLVQMYESEENAAVMRVVLIIKALSWLPFLVLSPMRHPLMPRVTLICIAAAFLLDVVAINFIIGLDFPKSAGVNVFNLIIAVAFSIYLIRSKRVNLTYRLRERTG